MITKIKTYSHEENWKICGILEELGYEKEYDCMWVKGFTKDNQIVTVELILEL